MTKNKDESHYIIEYISLGNSVKVTAFDPTTLREVSIVGSPKVPNSELAKLAVRKLQYMNRKAKDKS